MSKIRQIGPVRRTISFDFKTDQKWLTQLRDAVTNRSAKSCHSHFGPRRDAGPRSKGGGGDEQRHGGMPVDPVEADASCEIKNIIDLARPYSGRAVRKEKSHV